jgi:hypothetical protein
MTVQNSGTPGPWVVKKCGCGSPYCHIYYTSNGTFYQGSGFSLADATRIARVPEMETRIAELEAEVAEWKEAHRQACANWLEQCEYEMAKTEAAEAEVARLRDVQADADAIRKAALESAIAALNRVELCGKTPQEMHAALNQYAESRYAIFALIDNPGKEVMPDDRPVRDRHADTGPGDQTVAGAVPRRASGPIDPEAGFATSGAEARWIADVDAGVYDDDKPVAGAAPNRGAMTIQVWEHEGTWTAYCDALGIATHAEKRGLAIERFGMRIDEEETS